MKNEILKNLRKKLVDASTWKILQDLNLLINKWICLSFFWDIFYLIFLSKLICIFCQGEIANSFAQKKKFLKLVSCTPPSISIHPNLFNSQSTIQKYNKSWKFPNKQANKKFILNVVFCHCFSLTFPLRIFPKSVQFSLSSTCFAFHC